MKLFHLASIFSLGLAAVGAIAHSGNQDERTQAVHTSPESGGHGEALGKAGDPKKVSRTIKVRMSDEMRFEPARIKVRQGETIRFVVTNGGRIKHEMVLGNIEELKEHAELMRKFPEMEHADPNAISVEPGKTGTLVWQFTNAGTFDFACLVPGHFEAGMAGKVLVSR